MSERRNIRGRGPERDDRGWNLGMTRNYFLESIWVLYHHHPMSNGVSLKYSANHKMNANLQMISAIL